MGCGASAHRQGGSAAEAPAPHPEPVKHEETVKEEQTVKQDVVAGVPVKDSVEASAPQQPDPARAQTPTTTSTAAEDESDKDKKEDKPDVATSAKPDLGAATVDPPEKAFDDLIPEGLSPRTEGNLRRRIQHMGERERQTLRADLVMANARFEEKLHGRPSNGDLSPLVRRSSMPLWGETDHAKLRSLQREFMMGQTCKKTADFERFLATRRTQIQKRIEAEGYVEPAREVPKLGERGKSRLLQRRASARVSDDG